MEFENDIVIIHEVKKPHVVLIENDNDEEFLINGESACCHKRLYPFDVLDALQKKGWKILVMFS